MLRTLNARSLLRTSCYTCSFSRSSVLDTKQTLNNQSIDLPEQKVEDDQQKEPSKSKIVAAAFASLKHLSLKKSKLSPSVSDIDIFEAKDVDSLLALTENAHVSRHDALKIVSILADWASKRKIKLSDFDTDVRFIKLCRTLSSKYNGTEMTGDLSLVLGVTGDDQAAKLVGSISLSQMVKVLTSLSSNRRRSVPLLRSLSFNIGKESARLNIKEAADVLYACVTLNFPDEVLLEKVAADICECIDANEKSSVIGSILTSVGMLKYKNVDLLDSICNWIVENSDTCRQQEFTSVLLTFASVNYIPQKFNDLYGVIEPYIIISEVNNLDLWLDIVWSLIVLEKANENQLSSVLCSDFVSKILKGFSDESNVVVKLKLLNINGYAKLKGSGYKGPLLNEEDDLFNVPISRTKEKQVLVQSVIDTLSNIVGSSDCLQKDVNTQMGYLIDAECYMNNSKSFIPAKDAMKFQYGTIKKIAIMVCGYHDICRGSHNELTGIAHLTHCLTTLSGYKIITVPYTEFSPKEKIVNRVNYLDKKLKDILKEFKT